MTEWGRGAKAGLVSGLISGAIIGVIFAAWLAISVSPEKLASPEVDSEAAYSIYWAIIVGSIFSWSTFFGPALGTLLGLVFAATYMKLPTKTALSKGIVLGTAFWIVIFWILVPLAVGDNSYLTATIGSIPYGALLIVNGALLGFFWNRFGPYKIFGSGAHVKAIFERQFPKLRDDEIYVVAKRWFDGIRPVRGWGLSSRAVLVLLIIFAFVDVLLSGAQGIIPLSVYVAISLAQLTILLWLGTRKVKPKIVEEKPPNQLVFTAVTTRLAWPSKVEVSILNSSVKMEFSIFGGQLVATWIERGWESISSNLWSSLRKNP